MSSADTVGASQQDASALGAAFQMAAILANPATGRHPALRHRAVRRCMS